jgi:hypothetical protein
MAITLRDKQIDYNLDAISRDLTKKSKSKFKFNKTQTIRVLIERYNNGNV